MKSLRMLLPILLISMTAVAVAQSDAQKSFDQLKALAGTWEGTFDGKPTYVTLRVISTGNALVHEMTGSEKPSQDKEHPITMFYLEGDRLLLTHYCDAGNRPRMVAATSADGKTINFDLLDVANLLPSQDGHMQHAVFNLIDANHHTEKWEFAMKDGKPMGGVLDLKRIQ